MEADQPWTFRDDLVLLADGVREGRTGRAPLVMVSMWVQLHNVPPMNMTATVATKIGG